MIFFCLCEIENVLPSERSMFSFILMVPVPRSPSQTAEPGSDWGCGFVAGPLCSSSLGSSELSSQSSASSPPWPSPPSADSASFPAPALSDSVLWFSTWHVRQRCSVHNLLSSISMLKVLRTNLFYPTFYLPIQRYCKKYMINYEVKMPLGLVWNWTPLPSTLSSVVWASWALSSVLDSLVAFSSPWRRSTLLCSLLTSRWASSRSTANTDRLLFSSSSSDTFFLRSWMWSSLLSRWSFWDFNFWKEDHFV